MENRCGIHPCLEFERAVQRADQVRHDEELGEGQGLTSAFAVLGALERDLFKLKHILRF
jgi:hypothetical protein